MRLTHLSRFLCFFCLLATGPALADSGSVQMASAMASEAKADLVVVYKGERLMHVMRDGDVMRSFRVALGDNPVGHKQREGDERTPEGVYELDFRLEDSNFHRAIRVSYPNYTDRAFAAQRGWSPGGQIMIHGLPNGLNAAFVGHPYDDWTDGCIAVTNAEMDFIWQVVDVGTRILILP